MADRIPDSIIDDILESTKKYSQDVETASMDEIDALLASLGVEPKEDQPKKAEKIEPVIEETVKAPSDEKVIVEEASKEVISEISEEPKVTEVAETETLEPEEEKKQEKKKSSSFLDLIKNKNKVLDESVDDTQDEFEDISSDSKGEPENVTVYSRTDGQMELQVDGEEISAEEIEPLETPEEPKTAPSVSGQISIEKTRMFNEVKIHGDFNPNISHNLGNKVTRTTTGEGEALSTPVMGEEKYRKHFMNKPVQNLEKTQEHRAIIDSLPEKTMETPGVIVKKNKDASTNTDGFEPIPTIVPAEYEIQGEIHSHSEDIPEGQIMLEGFGEEDVIEKTTEEEAEAKLLEARKEAVKEFVDKGLLFKQDDKTEDDNSETQTEFRKKRYARKNISIAREFFGPKDADAVIYEYYHEKKKLTAKLISLSVICGIMTILSMITGLSNGNFDMFGGEEFIYIVIELLLLLVCSAISIRSFKQVIHDIKSLKPDLNLVVVVSALAGILQAVVSCGFTDTIESSVHLFTAAAVIPMIFKTAGELIECKNDLENFYIISDNENGYYTVENIEDEDTAAEIARGLMLGEPEIKYSAKTKFPSRFVELSREADVTPSILKYSLLGVCGVALLVGIITGILEKNILFGVTAFAGALLMGVPASAGIISAASLSHANKKLRNDGTVINGYAAVENAINSNGIIIDAGDAFKSGGCNIEGIKLYHKMRIDEALLYTASVVIASGGVLSEIFEGVIIGKNELLLPVETLAYEEKLGCSCWIHNHRVLVGNKELLKHHNVEIPDDGLEEKFREAGKNTLYLAIEGKLSAMFIVSYKADEETAHYIRALEKDGVSILFRTSDANITESFLEREFRLPKNVVKIINPVAGEMFTKVKTAEKEKSDAFIVHDGSVLSMLKALHISFGVSQFVNVSRTVQGISAIIGVLIVALLSFMSGLSQVSAWQIVMYQIIWGVVLYALPAIKKPNKRVR